MEHTRAPKANVDRTIGGRYDGILGVQAGLEIMRTLQQNNVQTEYPTALINWTKCVDSCRLMLPALTPFPSSEEGARFPKSVISSSVWAGVIPIEEAWALADVKDSSATMRSELERIGFFGSVECSYKVTPLAAHFELHIGTRLWIGWSFYQADPELPPSAEQGPILEATGKRIGVVLGGQAYRWYTLKVHGRDSHTGTDRKSVV